ncbi:hypothetical protein Ahy_A09g046051 isoform A [Arachis hypogaea]|uniref:ATP-dependent RNA helicase n=1 Tax=Arachis hypogaea TaxID=3818 RepID=A0A445BNR3_ARAHY|nr:hypothetical protein Ahy_A09g046051 isoform A [Arachis hypogaea]
MGGKVSGIVIHGAKKRKSSWNLFGRFFSSAFQFFLHASFQLHGADPRSFTITLYSLSLLQIQRFRALKILACSTKLWRSGQRGYFACSDLFAILLTEVPLLSPVMAGLAPEGTQFDARQYDAKMSELLSTDGQEFFTSYDEVYDSFDAMGLQENLLRGIYAYGFERPSAIQQRGIVPFCKGLDVIQQAQSGTGKTATFCSGILQQLDYGLVQCQALVLAPTRELAQQIEKVMRALGDYLGVKVHACVGGTSVREDQRILQAGVHTVVGTPGRVFDMLRRQSLRPDHIKMFVLDEADEMLSRDL